MKRVFKDTGRSINNIDILDIEPVDLNWSPEESSGESSSVQQSRVPNPPVDDDSSKDSSYDPSNIGYSSTQDDSEDNNSGDSGDSSSMDDTDNSAGSDSSSNSDNHNSKDTGSEDSSGGSSGNSDNHNSKDTGSKDTGSEDTGSEDTGSEDSSGGSSDNTGSKDTGSEDSSGGSSDNTGSKDTGSEDSSGGSSDNTGSNGYSGDDSSYNSSQEDSYGGSTTLSSKDNLEDLLKEQESSGKSLMESMLEDIENNKSEVESSMDSKMTRDYNEDNKKSSNTSKDKSSESSTAKSMVGSAIKNSEEIDDISYGGSIKDERDSLLSAAGASSITSMFNYSIKSDWKSKLDSLFDKASGYDVVMNPNMINKRIEGAPPGREDIASKFNAFVVAVDVSGSMGSGKFKQVISHIDTMLKARNLSSVRFYLVAWGPFPEEGVIDSIKVTKGRQVRTVLLSDKNYTRASGGTAIYPLFKALATKVRNPDAIFILTDGDLQTSYHKSEASESYIKRHHNKIIWCLTHGSTLNRGVSEVDSRVKKERRYIIFHGK